MSAFSNPMLSRPSTSSLGMSLAGNSSRRNPLFNDKAPSGYKTGYLQQFTPEQMQLYQQLFGNLGPDSFLQQLSEGSPEAFEEMEAPAWKNLAQAQGMLGSRYSGMGQGAQRSSGFRNEQNQLSSDFAQQLASRRADYRRQALSDLMGFSNQLLGQRPYERTLTEKGPSGFQKFMNTISPMAQAGAGLAGSYFGSRA